MKITATQRFKIASERVKIETHQLTVMSTRIRLKSETSEQTSNDIMSVVCEVFAIKEEDVRSRSRERAISTARHTYCFLCSSLDSTTTLQRIGESVARDHSTVIHSIKKVNDLRETDITYAALFQKCIYRLSKTTEENMSGVSFQIYSKKQLEIQQAIDAVGIVRGFMDIWDAQVLVSGFSKNNKDVVASFNDLRVEAAQKGF